MSPTSINLTAADVMMFNVVRLALPDQPKALATAFALAVDDVVWLVTCKHVFDGLAPNDTVLVQGPARGPNETKWSLDVRAASAETKVESWRQHPDAALDLAAVHIGEGGPVHSALRIFALTEYALATQAQLNELFAVEDITMVGCPDGVWDESTGFPVFRRGISATHPAVNYKERPVGLVDVACFPGSSGSPVVLLNQGAFAVKASGPIIPETGWVSPGIKVGQRLLVLGILTDAYFQVTEGRLDGLENELDIRPVLNSALHLGCYLKGQPILQFLRGLKTP